MQWSIGIDETDIQRERRSPADHVQRCATKHLESYNQTQRESNELACRRFDDDSQMRWLNVLDDGFAIRAAQKSREEIKNLEFKVNISLC